MKRLSIIGFLAIALAGQSQIIINEFTASNYSHFGLGPWNDEFEDWVEIHNNGAEQIDIGGYYLSDDMANPAKWQIPLGTTIQAGGFELIILNGRGSFEPEVDGYLSANFKFKQTEGEALVFSNSESVVLESYSFAEWGPTQQDHSFARNEEGDWFKSTTPTPGTANAGAFFSSYASKPYLIINPGWYLSDLSLEVFNEDEEVMMYYTLDGTEPDQNSNLYVGPIEITQTSVLKVIAISDDPSLMPSYVETNTYFINQAEHDLPMISISGPALSDGEWQAGDNDKTVLEYFDEDNQFICEAHGDTNEHGSDSNVYDQRGFDFITQDELGYDHHVANAIFSETTRDEFQRLIFKCGGWDNYPYGDGAHMRDAMIHTLSHVAGLNLDERSSKYCALYVNGQYWGLYTVQEKVDDLDYVRHYYDQEEGDFDFLKTWGGTWAEYGVLEPWFELNEEAGLELMCDNVTYEYISDNVDISSFIDFYILQTFILNKQILNWDQAWWRGYGSNGVDTKWRYALWSSTHSMGHGINFLGWPSTEIDTPPCAILDFDDPGGAGHIPFLNDLFESPEFEQQFVNRYFELSNSHLSCESMNNLIDSLHGTFESEMQRHIERWEGSIEEWEGEIQELRNWIDARCGDTIEGLVEECWGLPDEIDELTVSYEGNGAIDISSANEDFLLDEPDSPISVQDCPNTFELTAIGLYFENWEVLAGDFTLDDPGNPVLPVDVDDPIHIKAIFQDIPDSIHETDLVEFELFPNPAKEMITIQTNVNHYTIRIFDSSGRVVFQKEVNNGKNVSIPLNVTAGSYQLSLIHEKGVSTQRLIVGR